MCGCGSPLILSSKLRAGGDRRKGGLAGVAASNGLVARVRGRDRRASRERALLRVPFSPTPTPSLVKEPARFRFRIRIKDKTECAVASSGPWTLGEPPPHFPAPQWTSRRLGRAPAGPSRVAEGGWRRKRLPSPWPERGPGRALFRLGLAEAVSRCASSTVVSPQGAAWRPDGWGLKPAAA